jgi:CRP/FNR family transcriptional regulator
MSTVATSRAALHKDTAHVVKCATLRVLDIFRNLSPDDIKHLTEVSTFRRIDRRGPIGVPGAESSHLCLLTEGTAKAARLDSRGSETILYLMKRGEMFGGHVTELRADFALIAVEPCATVCIQIRELKAILGPAVLSKELDRLRIRRVQQMEDRIAEMGAGRVAERAARMVLRLCREFPARMKCGVRVNVMFTQQDIANLIGATREVTSSTLNDFKRRGWLDVHNRYMCVHNADGLAARADSANAHLSLSEMQRRGS